MCSWLPDFEDELNETTEQPVEISYQDLSRRDVRSLVFHLLYAMDAFDYEEPLQTVVDNFNRGFNLSIPMDGELVAMVRSIIDHADELDDLYKNKLANWRFERIGLCTKLILRYAVWEMQHTKTDPRIIINEAVELAKCFAEQDAYKFINGVLDRVAKELGLVSEENPVNSK